MYVEAGAHGSREKLRDHDGEPANQLGVMLGMHVQCSKGRQGDESVLVVEDRGRAEAASGFDVATVALAPVDSATFASIFWRLFHGLRPR